MGIKKLSLMLLSALSLAALLNGCGSSSKEGTPGGVAKVADEGVCIVCHSTTIDPQAGSLIVQEYAQSGHNPKVGSAHSPGCEGCHGGGSQHNGVGPLPYPDPFHITATAANGNVTTMCQTCHKGAYGQPDALWAKGAANFHANCANCHTANGTGSIHGVISVETILATKDCVDCHSIAAPQHQGLVNDNDGVRAITGEFAKRSHHVSGRTPRATDCVVCHMEGTVSASGSNLVVDENFHMKDDKIYLRNGNDGLTGNQTKAVAATVSTASYYAWQPSAPDYTLMDQFCFSCHNNAGAVTAVATLAALPAVSVPRTALNPFGDTISNGYDQVLRPAVVGVYEQFDTGNTSHHAVRGKKYTASTLVGQTAIFSQISSVNAGFTQNNLADPIKGVKSIVGSIKDLNLFTATYTTVDGAALADNATIHCADCHTVGQFTAGSAKKADGTPTTVVIGAHGSNNEYLLRNAQSDDTFEKDGLVCYLCHTVASYGDTTAGRYYSATSSHNNANGSDDHCNSATYNSAGLVGLARLVPFENNLTEGNADDMTAEITAGKYAPTGGGNIFGIKCLNCHNAGAGSTSGNPFGGIHGNAGNASYKAYSGGKNALIANATVTVDRKPYRFMPGLGNFRYNGGDSTAQWTVKALTSANKQGCYTLNGASTRAMPGDLAGAPRPNPAPTKALNSGANVSALALPQGDNGILGSWGACTDHAGTSTYGGQHDPSRSILRPLSY